MARSSMGVASVVLSVFSGLLFGLMVGAFYLVEYLDVFAQDDAGWAFLFLLGSAHVLLFGVAAFVLGLAGLFQKRRKRASALLGVACSALVFLMLYIQPIWRLPPGNF